jgi:hypothetical protein
MHRVHGKHSDNALDAFTIIHQSFATLTSKLGPHLQHTTNLTP